MAKFNQAQARAIAKRYEAGESIIGIAVDLGVNKLTVRRAIIRAAGKEALRGPGRIPSPTASPTAARRMRMKKEGMTLAEIAKAEGVTRQAIKRSIERWGSPQVIQERISRK